METPTLAESKSKADNFVPRNNEMEEVIAKQIFYITDKMIIKEI